MMMMVKALNTQLLITDPTVWLMQRYYWLNIRRAGSEDCNPTANGFYYTGHTSVTENGRQCQAWTSQTPHSNLYTDDSDFPDESIADASNYCRNPANDWSRLWCYTTDPDVTWEKCIVPLCGKSLRRSC